MNKIWLIIKREYLVRVRKRSFIIMTILGPLLMASLLVVPIYLASESQQERMIAISEDKEGIAYEIEGSQYLRFTIIPESEALEIKENFEKSPFYALLTMEKDSFTLYSSQQISLNVSSEIESKIEKIIEHKKLKELGINPQILEQADIKIQLTTKILSEDGNSIKSQTEASVGIGFFSGILIYMFIFMYGTMVMRGVIEEKTNRIVEIIISSVKPFQLMMGKILGVALVGLTQFILWILLTLLLYMVAEYFVLDMDMLVNNMSREEESIILAQINQLTGGIDLMQIFISFLFYFFAGYLMYSSLFAAIGSAVDAEADSQQFILPITIPLILSFILIQPIMDNPDSSLAFWMSMIPFTSPVIMMVRLPFGVASWEIILSMFILVGSFILSTWIAGRIYRVGILMYGKKNTYKELFRWISYRP